MLVMHLPKHIRLNSRPPHGWDGWAYSNQNVREEVLAEQITDVLQKVSLPPLWADNMLAKIESEREQDAQNGVAFAQNLKQEIEDLDERLDKLLDTHLDGLIPKVEYAEKKQKILNRKIDVSEKLKDFEQKGNHRLEPPPRAKGSAFLSEKIVGNPFEFLGFRHSRHSHSRFARAEFWASY